ncbi:hypothetical protein BCON_0105g00210 [Botryotinia convoluta]|uniref:Uncharacterized protein n=1 Tax=Botryotinia convoluta TaxID=54673 RepID=A0A4Z1I525_9HELO|nr:hypothetical protein BCON_0105g00210 [Botryotinia convoluta]
MAFKPSNEGVNLKDRLKWKTTWYNEFTMILPLIVLDILSLFIYSNKIVVKKKKKTAHADPSWGCHAYGISIESSLP